MEVTARSGGTDGVRPQKQAEARGARGAEFRVQVVGGHGVSTPPPAQFSASFYDSYLFSPHCPM